MSFDKLGLSAEIVRAVKDRKYTTPTSIQAQAIPLILEKKDILGGAQTGTGKTASFTLPVLQLIQEKIDKKEGVKVRALILAPTRELAAQVHDSILSYGKYLNVKSTVLFGGVGLHLQAKKLRRGVDVVVATPGRLLDHVRRRNIDLSTIEMFVLDEADCMLDMGFIHDIRAVIELLPEKKQSLLFSATFSEQIRALTKSLLKDPQLLQISEQNKVSDQVKQVIYPVDRGRKAELLSHLITSNKWNQVLVFTRTKHLADTLTKKLKEEGIPTTAIHGNKTQAARSKALSNFKRGEVQVLVATDIASRGLDINQLPHVVNYELPFVPNDYIHRIGRTGRAGNEGEAVSLVCVDERGLLRDIERLTKKTFPVAVVPGFEIDQSIRPQSIGRGGGNRPSRFKGGNKFGNRNGGGGSKFGNRNGGGSRGKSRFQGRDDNRGSSFSGRDDNRGSSFSGRGGKKSTPFQANGKKRKTFSKGKPSRFASR